MGRKKSGSGPFGCVFGAIVLFAILPKEIWVIVIVISIIAVISYFISKGSQINKNPIHDTDVDEIETRRFKSAYTESGLRYSYRIPSPPPASVQNARWIPAGESVSVAEFTIPGGLIYVGSALLGRYGRQEPSLIDPQAPINKSGNLTERLMDYWPCYSEISPEARGAYLSWLATGRDNPDADVSNVFLFFYGLERRVLVDGTDDKMVAGDIPFIKNEVERLLNIYGKQSGSVQDYLSAFLSLLTLLDFSDRLYERPIPPLTTSYELPFYLRLALGQAAIDGVPVPANLALSWALYDPLISKRTPVIRCSEEFSGLFKLKYKQYYHEGLKLAVNRTKLIFNYRAASSALQGVVVPSKSFGNIPDIAAVTGPQKKLQNIVSECADELDGYSRFIGRNPDKKDSISAMLFLPVMLWPANACAVVASLKDTIKDGYVFLRVRDLLSKFGDHTDLSKEKLIALAKALESEHIAIEPDIISFPSTLKAEDSIILHILQTGIPSVRLTPEYQTAVLTLQLGVAVASSDGSIHEREMKYMNEQLQRWNNLSAYHLSRLQALLQLLRVSPITFTSLKKKLEHTQVDDRKSILTYVTRIVVVDGEAMLEEVAFLERVYKAFEVDVTDLYSCLHNAKPSGAVETKNAAVIALDHNKIENLRRDTENVAALLSDIFTEKEEEQNDLAEFEDDRKENILGLDDTHAAFLHILLAKSSWNREELADLGKDLDLMVDGAIETINEASFKKLEQAVLEGYDPVEINLDIREKVLI